MNGALTLKPQTNDKLDPKTQVSETVEAASLSRRGYKKLLAEKQREYELLYDETLKAMEQYRYSLDYFEFMTDAKLIDTCIYEIKRSESEFEYLLLRLKAKHAELTALKNGAPAGR